MDPPSLSYEPSYLWGHGRRASNGRVDSAGSAVGTRSSRSIRSPGNRGQCPERHSFRTLQLRCFLEGRQHTLSRFASVTSRDPSDFAHFKQMLEKIDKETVVVTTHAAIHLPILPFIYRFVRQSHCSLHYLRAEDLTRLYGYSQKKPNEVSQNISNRSIECDRHLASNKQALDFKCLKEEEYSAINETILKKIAGSPEIITGLLLFGFNH
jgi:hypothetical protein